MNPLRWLWKQLAGPEDEAEPATDALVTVSTANSEGLAGLWQSTLDDQGIRCLVKSVGLVPVYGGSQMFEVQVRYRDLERACALLGVDEAHGEDADEAPDLE